ncbi:hypothetical protein AR9_g209 [Bacillus phage AR9]|uniref:Uncharacterized protein n=2 Tax=Bacillus phage PBS1 TaxID=10683 RepID=A0A172JIB7_BPPB1|nr:hypothetical protein BI022_gp208 [Bacillus phage AR9]YP_009664302.1 hypothetical protein FK780_gp100 [Bacillus phage PBS1]PTU25914.1 hypothetical protein DA469_21255 [Bacillus subtilis]QXN70131.1 hypothetical protein INTERNEXUS_90 [Bacillus phage vB_BspM_Internexus]WCS68337.1 hypothetical protein Goe21_02270 [Bacillus phage vB_BsuM-Goe21]AMS01293.1 hypothetical protein AR9_g209 [Bacillus phage AR9]AST99922.1 hypothetical protein PBI_PBS1_100 [Bacillus phage PBS1]
MENAKSLADTSKYLNQSDIENIVKVNKIKKDITSFFDMDLFINKMRDIIDESEHFDFRSKTSRLYIEKERPNFILKYVSDELTNKINSVQGSDPEETESIQIDIITEYIFNDVISKFSTFVTDCIKDTEKLNDLFSDIPDDIKDILISNIYTIRPDIKGNNIQVLYFI